MTTEDDARPTLEWTRTRRPDRLPMVRRMHQRCDGNLGSSHPRGCSGLRPMRHATRVTGGPIRHRSADPDLPGMLTSDPDRGTVVVSATHTEAGG